MNITSIQQKIDEALKKEQEKERTHSGKYWISSLGRCLRFQYWQMKNEPQTNPVDSRTLRVFKCGSLFHDFVQGFVNGQAQTEVLTETDELKGRADIVTDDEVIEIKSQHSFAFHYMRKETYDIVKEKECNILQLMTYAWILKKPKGRLIFVSKDDLCIAEYSFFLEHWKSKIQDEVDILRYYMGEGQNEIPPAKPRAYGGNEKKYCPYADKCPECKLKEKPKKVKK